MSSELAKKIAKVAATMGNVPKTGNNTFQKYRYRTEDDVFNMLRPKLAELGIAVYYDCLEVYDLDNGRTRVKCQFTLVDGDSGEERVSINFGEARDVDSQGRTQDKGLYKAITGACKYWAFKTFLVSDGEDPESTPNTYGSDSKGKTTFTKPGATPAGFNHKALYAAGMKAFNSDSSALSAYLKSNGVPTGNTNNVKDKALFDKLMGDFKAMEAKQEVDF